MNGPDPDVARVADKLGLKRVGASQLQCPRSRCNGDGKGSVAIYSDGDHWRCVRCSAYGDALAYAAYATLGEVPLKNSPRWASVFARLDGRPGSAAGKPVAGSQPNPGVLSKGNRTTPRPGTVLYFAAPRTPFIPLPFRRRGEP